MTKRQIIIARIILVLYMVALVLLCVLNFKTPPNVQKTLFGIPTDKIVHFCMFFPMPIIAFFAFDKYTEKVWSSILFTALAFIVSVGFATLTEWAQGLTPARSREHADFIADVIALGVSSVIVLVLDISKQKKPVK